MHSCVQTGRIHLINSTSGTTIDYIMKIRKYSAIFRFLNITFLKIFIRLRFEVGSIIARYYFRSAVSIVGKASLMIVLNAMRK